ncbi:MAG: PDZ domain-containing protein [Sphingomicrobium sp.]
MGKVDRLWTSPWGLLLLSALIALGLFLALRPLELQGPATGRGRALLRLDHLLGATVEPLDIATASQSGLSPGGGELVVTSIASNGPAAKAGLRVGDVVERIGSQPAAQASVAAPAQFPVPVLINRRGGRAVLSIRSVRG